MRACRLVLTEIGLTTGAAAALAAARAAVASEVVSRRFGDYCSLWRVGWALCVRSVTCALCCPLNACDGREDACKCCTARHTEVCPTCATPVQKRGGCHHMTCPAGHSFVSGAQMNCCLPCGVVGCYCPWATLRCCRRPLCACWVIGVKKS